jgi:hypothetical protein
MGSILTISQQSVVLDLLKAQLRLDTIVVDCGVICRPQSLYLLRDIVVARHPRFGSGL